MYLHSITQRIIQITTNHTMLKPLLVIFLTMASALSLNPAALRQDENSGRDDYQVFEEIETDRKNMTRIYVKNDTKMNRAGNQRYTRDVNGQQDQSYLCDNLGNEDYPVVVVIGDSGVGKSTLFNYIGNFNEGDQCYFEKGESNLGSGVTSETVAKKLLYRGNPNLNLIGVDTPGLSDVRGKGQDKTFMKDIAMFLGSSLKDKKIALFLYVFKGTETRYNFDSLKVYNAMFGQSFFNHLAVEVTFWSHDPVSKMKRLKNRQIDETILTQKIRDELIKSTRIEPNVAEKVPVVFVDPVYDPLDFQYYPQFMKDEIAQLQAQQEDNLKREIFDSSREGTICDADCQDATSRVIQILDNDFNPVIREGDELTIYQGTSLQLTCIVPIMEHNCPCFAANWLRDDSLIEQGEFIVSIEEDNSGIYKSIELSHKYVSTLETGLYQCKASTCKLGSNACEEKQSNEIQVTVNSLPPEIRFTNANEINCIQEFPGGKSVQVSFRIYRKDIDSNVEYLISDQFVENENKFIEAGKKIEKKFHNRITKDELTGEYFCQTQFGESNRIRVERPDIDGGWSSWGMFYSCSVTCGGGFRSRRRDCTAPEKLNNGKDCEGPNEQKLHCNTHDCEENIELVQAVDGSQNVPLYVETESRHWCCLSTSVTQICQTENIGSCPPLDLYTNHCFGGKCIGRSPSKDIKTALSEVNIDIQNDCQNINMIGIHINLKDLEREVNKCDESTRKSITIKADTITTSESVTITGAHTVNIMARIIVFDSDTNLEIAFNQWPAEDYGYRQTGTKPNGIDGSNGQVGHRGVNGAHISISTDYMMTRKLTKIVVEGGQGSKGQDGANGAKGADGTDMDGLNTRFFKDDWKEGRRKNYGIQSGLYHAGGYLTGKCLKFLDHAYTTGFSNCHSGFVPSDGGVGRRGGNGGNGGNGGIGGTSGYIQVKVLKKVNGEIITKRAGGAGGQGGAHGDGASGGNGGKPGFGVSPSKSEDGGRITGNCYRNWGQELGTAIGHALLTLGSTRTCYYLELIGSVGRTGSAGYSGSNGRIGSSGNIDVIPQSGEIGSSLITSILEKRSLQYLMLNEDIKEDDLNLFTRYEESGIANSIERKYVISNVGSTGSKIAFGDNLNLLAFIVEVITQYTNWMQIGLFQFRQYNEITSHASQVMAPLKLTEKTTLTYKKTRLQRDISQMDNLISLFNEKQNYLLESLSHTVTSELDSKISLINDKGKADIFVSILKTGLSVVSLGAGLGKFGASLATGKVNIDELIPSETDSVTSIITKSTTLVTQGISVGCKDTLLTDVIKSITHHTNLVIELDLKRSNGQEIGNDDENVLNIEKYKNEEVTQLIQRFLRCIFHQSIDYQKEQLVEAKYLENTIDGYFTADNQRLTLMESMYEKKQELDSVQDQLDNPLKHISEINGILHVTEGLKMFYSDMEYETLILLQDYVDVLKYQYPGHFEAGTAMGDVLKHPLSLPMSQNYEALQGLNSIITKEVNNAKNDMKTPFIDEFSEIITNEDILRELETTFQTKLTFTDKIVHHTNIRIKKIYVSLEFTSYPDTTPDEIYVEVRQDAITKFYLQKAINKFEPKSPESILDQKVSHFQDPATEDLCSRGGDDMCPGLPNSFYINIPRSGGDQKISCPNYAELVNCQGLQLKHLKALHVAVQYSYRK